MNITCSWRFSIVTRDPATVPDEVDSIMEHLVALEDDVLHDAAIALDLAARSLEITIAVEAESLEHGVQAGVTAIRTAIHAAGGATPDWPTSAEAVGTGLQLLHGQLVAA